MQYQEFTIILPGGESIIRISSTRVRETTYIFSVCVYKEYINIVRVCVCIEGEREGERERSVCQRETEASEGRWMCVGGVCV
jgi:hypothetical protein